MRRLGRAPTHRPERSGREQRKYYLALPGGGPIGLRSGPSDRCGRAPAVDRGPRVRGSVRVTPSSRQHRGALAAGLIAALLSGALAIALPATPARAAANLYV